MFFIFYVVAFANETIFAQRLSIESHEREIDEKEKLVKNSQEILQDLKVQYSDRNQELGLLQQKYTDKMEEIDNLEGEYKDIFMRMGKQGEILLESEKQKYLLQQKNVALESEKDKISKELKRNEINHENYLSVKSENEILQKKILDLQNQISVDNESNQFSEKTEMASKEVKEMEHSGESFLTELKLEISRLEELRKEDERNFYEKNEMERWVALTKRVFINVLSYIILYYTILYYTILYYTILYNTILYYTILYYIILYYTILYYTILYYTIVYYTIVYYTVLYYTILYYTFL